MSKRIKVMAVITASIIATSGIAYATPAEAPEVGTSVATEARQIEKRASDVFKARKVAWHHKKATRDRERRVEERKQREAEARKAAEQRSIQARASRTQARTTAPTTPVKVGSRPTGLWLELAKCESGANLQKNTGNGYYGAYQFSPNTWQGFTHGRFGPVLSNGWAVQTYVAYRIWLKQGWGGYPGCGAKMGYPTMPPVAAP